MVASILNIIITRNTICDNLVSVPRLGHISALIFAYFVINYYIIKRYFSNYMNYILCIFSINQMFL